MGVPAFFRWLSTKYPSIISFCVEEKFHKIDGEYGPIDLTQPNANGIEIDNLYLDMNGIIHPCTHPENEQAPATQAEMFRAITRYIDRIINITRPRKLVYFAIDGVAPRAKMNQQRSRRFRSSRDKILQEQALNNMIDIVRKKGYTVPEQRNESSFDSNCITPGTEFMKELSEYLVGYIAKRVNDCPGWQDLVIIHSDASVPGEGEHKIMDFIRRQRAASTYDPNMVHCIYGADADLIMLGLATHEPNFIIIRENFKPYNDNKPCPVCHKYGHQPTECKGIGEETGDECAPPMLSGIENEFIFIRLSVLREYLRRDFYFTEDSLRLDFERMIDDWVLICFLVGNDFLPHLPSLEIREHAIDKIWNLYQNRILKFNGYLCDGGKVDIDNFKIILSDLGMIEDNIFKRRSHRKRSFLERKKSTESLDSWKRDKGPTNEIINDSIKEPQNLSDITDITSKKRRLSERSDLEKEIDDFENDPIKLGQEGWKFRYYQNKFKIEAAELDDYRSRLAKEYLIGVNWVLEYYYQGCASWEWSYPFHYAPFASDFSLVDKIETQWNNQIKDPFLPFEQLMAVLPESSKDLIPNCYHTLMQSHDSPIIDFYPMEFNIDLNGKMHEWQGVALLPFIDQNRLRESMIKVENLSSRDKKLNSFGETMILLKDSHILGKHIVKNSELLENQKVVNLDDSKSCVLFGNIKAINSIRLQKETIESLKDVNETVFDNVLCLYYFDPVYTSGTLFKSGLLAGAKIPRPILKPKDIPEGRPYVPIINFPDSKPPEFHLDLPAKRFIERGINMRFEHPSSLHARNDRHVSRSRGDTGARYRAYNDSREYHHQYYSQAVPRYYHGYRDTEEEHWRYGHAERRFNDEYRRQNDEHRPQNDEYRRHDDQRHHYRRHYNDREDGPPFSSRHISHRDPRQ